MATPLESSPKLKIPSIDQIVNILEEMFKNGVLFDEPMYELNDKNIKKLESSIQIPNISFFGREKYKTIEEKAAALFYFVVKNHSFPNGNKRTAIILMLLFLMYNGYWLTISQNDLYKLSIRVASNTNRRHDKNIKEIEDIIRSNLRILKK